MKKHILSLAICSLGLGAFSQLPNHQWTKSADGGALARGYCITSDPFGNVYTAGVFSGTNDFDPSASVSNLSSFGSDDIFIVKTSSDGNFIWAKNIGGTQADLPNDITVDINGNIYLTGDFSGTADFNTEAGVTNLISAGGTDAFVVKLSPAGQLVWAKNVGGSGADTGQAVDIDDYNGDVYVIGSFTGTSDFDPGSATMNATSNGSTDIFMLKLTNSGDYLLSKTIGGISADRGRDITVDAISGDQFMTGFYGSTTDFDPGAGVVELTGGNNIFILKLDVNNNFVFAKSMGGIAADEGRNIAFDANGFIYVHGSFISTCNFNTSGGTTNVTSNGSDDVFVVQLTPSGDLNWVKTFGSVGTEDFMDMSVDSAGEIYLTGEMSGDMDANPDLVAVNTLTKKGAEDAYIISLRNNGDYNWSTNYGVLDPSIFTRAFGIHVDEQSNVYTTGSFYSTVDFNPSPATTNVSAISGADIWYQKLGPETNGINENSSISAISVSPNPSEGMFTLTTKTPMFDAEINVVDVNGAVIQTISKNDFNTCDLNLEGNANGIYFIHIRAEQLHEVIKLIKR